MIKTGAVVLLAMLSGCSPNEMTLQPTVIIDADLGARGMQEVIDGLESWGTVVPEVRPRFAVWSHVSAVVKSSGKTLPPNTVFVIAMRGNTVKGCPAGQGKELGGSLGRNRRTRNGSSVFCIDIGPAGIEDEEDHGHRQVAAHEFGHALGLPDVHEVAPKRVMFWSNDDSQLPLPSCDDGRALADHWGVSLASGC